MDDHERAEMLTIMQTLVLRCTALAKEKAEQASHFQAQLERLQSRSPLTTEAALRIHERETGG